MDAATVHQPQQAPAEAPKVKPCCVCKPQKAQRDECLLFHGQDSVECKPILDQYKDCMRGYGFTDYVVIVCLAVKIHTEGRAPGMGSIFLPHLPTAWHVDQAILSESDRLVVVRFGNDASIECLQMDELLYGIAEQVRNFAAVYVCDTSEVPDFNAMYELWDPVTVMFFYRNQHMMCDFGTGDNNKLNFTVDDPQDMIDVLETIYRAAAKGKRFTVSPIDFSRKRRR